jgi:hypothetical protein
MKHPGASFVIGTPIARRGPADNPFFCFGQIRMKCLGPSFVVGTSNTRRGPADNVFSILVKSGLSARNRPLWLEHPMPEEALQTTLFPFWSNQDEAPGTVVCRWNTHCQHDLQSRVMQPKEQQQTRIGLLSDGNVFVQWTTGKLMMASKWYSYR